MLSTISPDQMSEFASQCIVFAVRLRHANSAEMITADTAVPGMTQTGAVAVIRHTAKGMVLRSLV